MDRSIVSDSCDAADCPMQEDCFLEILRRRMQETATKRVVSGVVPGGMTTSNGIKPLPDVEKTAMCSFNKKPILPAA